MLERHREEDQKTVKPDLRAKEAQRIARLQADNENLKMERARFGWKNCARKSTGSSFFYSINRKVKERALTRSA